MQTHPSKPYKPERTTRYTQNAKQAAPHASHILKLLYWRFTHTIHDSNKQKEKERGLASDDQRSCMNITFLMTQVRIPPKVDDFSIQSLQHTPIICCCVVFSCLDFFKTKSQSNVIGQFVVKIFQICMNYILLCSVGAFTA